MNVFAVLVVTLLVLNGPLGGMGKRAQADSIVFCACLAVNRKGARWLTSTVQENVATRLNREPMVRDVYFQPRIWRKEQLLLLVVYHTK